MQAKYALVLAACFVLSIVGCGAGPQNPIVGKWEAGQADDKLLAEFTPDGKARITMFGKTFEGTYKLNDGELEWTCNGVTWISSVKVNATKLELTRDGTTVTYKKV